MCGIAGAVREILSPAEAGARPRSARLARTVAAMAEAQRHRGPDGDGLWESPGQEAVFGHRRLAVLDLTPAGAQPMVDPATGCAITFNGEIYNFRPLRAELQSLGETFTSSCDTEVILKAWSRWGKGALGRLRGIFAFALWDPRARAVYLARDPLGVKPLYWAAVRDPIRGGEDVLFASEVRALLAAGAVPACVDPTRVGAYDFLGPMEVAQSGRQMTAVATYSGTGGNSRCTFTGAVEYSGRLASWRGTFNCSIYVSLDGRGESPVSTLRTGSFTVSELAISSHGLHGVMSGADQDCAFNGYFGGTRTP